MGVNRVFRFPMTFGENGQYTGAIYAIELDTVLDTTFGFSVNGISNKSNIKKLEEYLGVDSSFLFKTALPIVNLNPETCQSSLERHLGYLYPNLFIPTYEEVYTDASNPYITHYKFNKVTILGVSEYSDANYDIFNAAVNSGGSYIDPSSINVVSASGLGNFNRLMTFLQFVSRSGNSTIVTSKNEYLILPVLVFSQNSFGDEGQILSGAKYGAMALTVRYRPNEVLNKFRLEFGWTGSKNIVAIKNVFVGKNAIEINPNVPDNPFEPIGPSGPSDPDDPGNFDDESDPVPIPTIPTFSSANTGFTRIYNPTLSQVQNLADYLWTDDSFFQTVWNRVKQVFENPISAIIGFNLVPVPVPDGGSKSFALMFIDTGVSMNVAASQFVDVDCGTLELEKYYGSALDYMPYTKVTCFLPYIGNVTLDTDEVMGRTLQITYRVDIVSGACVAYITVDGTVMYQFSGHCAINIPINSADFSTYISTIISAAKLALSAAGAAIGVATGADVPVATQHTTSTSTISKTARNPETGRQITTGTTTRTTDKEITTTKAAYEGIGPENIANTVGQIMGSKPHIDHTGSFSGNSGFLGVRRPYLIIERPNLCMPANYQTLNGFPAMYTISLSECKGYTRVQQVQLTGVWATNPEQAEILELLKMGVIF